jgi:hypothetical protein
MPVPPANVRAAARDGLALRAEYGRGGTEIGVARARDLANGRNISVDTLRRMVVYFERHEIDLDAPAAKRGNPGYPSAGKIAWYLWGADAGRAWAKRELARIDQQD